MKKYRYMIVLAAVALTSVVPAKAQYNETNNLFYHAFRTPQTNLLNPALFPSRNTVYLMLPGVDVQFGMPLGFNDILKYNEATQTTVIHVDSILHRLTEDNKLRMGFDLQLFGFGLKVRNLFVDLNMRLRASMSIGLPMSLVTSLLQGNVNDDGSVVRELDFLNGDLFGAQAYMEASLGGGYHIEKLNLTIGAHAKLLSGIVNLQTDKTRLVLETDEEQEHLKARMYYELQGAAIVGYDTAEGFQFDNIGNIMGGLFDNSGVAFDIGAKYDLGPFSFSLALLDLSAGIHWNKNVFSFVPEKEQAAVVEFSGVDINTVIDNGSFSLDTVGDYLKDVLGGMNPVYKKGSGDYWYPIPTKIHAGASFTFLKYLRAGLLFQGQLDRGLLSKNNVLEGYGKAYTNTFRWNTTLSFSANLFNWAELIVGSSVVYDGSKMDFFNPGAGFVMSIGTMLQGYVMADYVSSMRLVEAKAFNIKLGVNLLFGKGGKKKV